MARVEDITPLIAVEVPTGPESILRNMVVETARLFCRKTRYWRANLDDILMIPGQSRYDLFSPVNRASVYDVISVRYDKQTKFLNRSTYAKLQFDLDNSGIPTAFALESARELVLAPVPASSTAILKVRAVLVPDLDATEIDDRIYDDFGETILHGALFRLLRIPGKAWTNASMASFYNGLYEVKQQEATALADDEFTVGVKRVVSYGGY